MLRELIHFPYSMIMTPLYGILIRLKILVMSYNTDVFFLYHCIELN